jgi:hypothetical protein
MHKTLSIIDEGLVADELAMNISIGSSKIAADEITSEILIPFIRLTIV